MQEINKTANPALRILLKEWAAPVAGGIGTATIYDQYAYGGQPLDKTRAFNFLKNVGLSSLSYGAAKSAPNPFLSKGLVTMGALTPIGTNALVELPGTMSSIRNNNKNIFEKFNDLSPTQKTLAIAATGLTAAAAIPALMNISAAAKRLAEGRAVRLSTSIRKRRNQDKDLVIGVQPVSAPTQEEEPVPQQEESKGFLSKIFG